MAVPSTRKRPPIFILRLADLVWHTSHAKVSDFSVFWQAAPAYFPRISVVETPKGVVVKTYPLDFPVAS
jgi:hypothetical protein